MPWSTLKYKTTSFFPACPRLLFQLTMQLWLFLYFLKVFGRVALRKNRLRASSIPTQHNPDWHGNVWSEMHTHNTSVHPHLLKISFTVEIYKYMSTLLTCTVSDTSLHSFQAAFIHGERSNACRFQTSSEVIKRKQVRCFNIYFAHGRHGRTD